MMNSDDVITAYQGLSDLTGRMLEAARAGDWDHLVVLESDCERTLQTLKSDEAQVALPAERRDEKVRIIHQILAHDREIRDLAMPWMAQLSSMLRSAGTERKLVNAYARGAGL